MLPHTDGGHIHFQNLICTVLFYIIFINCGLSVDQTQQNKKITARQSIGKERTVSYSEMVI